VLNFRPWSLYLGENSPWCPVNDTAGPIVCLIVSGKLEILLPFSEIEQMPQSSSL
jgi:hypothetical protein